MGKGIEVRDKQSLQVNFKRFNFFGILGWSQGVVVVG